MSDESEIAKNMLNSMEIFANLKEDDLQVIEWLIEQAEQVDELEKENELYKQALLYIADISKLDKANYINRYSQDFSVECASLSERYGDIACQALERDSE